MTALVTISIGADQTVGWVLASAALIAALIYLIRGARKVLRIVRAIQNVVEGELEHNHGSSMKDDVHGIAVTVGNLARDVDDLKADLYTHLAEKGPRTP